MSRVELVNGNVLPEGAATEETLSDILTNDTTQYTTRIILDSNGSSEYICEAPPGNYNNTSLAIWRIRKILRTNISFPNATTAIIWASGNTTFDKIYDNYETYIYS